ncbi:MAG: hypothetical protein WCA22_08955 [Candidatus Binatus sp.]
MKKIEKTEHPVAKEGKVYYVVRKGEILKVRKFWSDAAGWQRQLGGSSIEVRKASAVEKPARAWRRKRRQRNQPRRSGAR